MTSFLFTYVYICSFNRFLIIKLLIKRLEHNQYWYGTFWSHGLEKTPRITPPCPCFFFCLNQCGLLDHMTCLKKMQFSKTDSAISLYLNKESSENINNYFGVLLQKQQHLLASVWRGPFPLSFCHRAACYHEAVSEQWAQQHFQALK